MEGPLFVVRTFIPNSIVAKMKLSLQISQLATPPCTKDGRHDFQNSRLKTIKFPLCGVFYRISARKRNNVFRCHNLTAVRSHFFSATNICRPCGFLLFEQTVFGDRPWHSTTKSRSSLGTLSIFPFVFTSVFLEVQTQKVAWIQTRRLCSYSALPW